MSSVSLISGTTKPYWRANFRRILATREAISSYCDNSVAVSSLLPTAHLGRFQLFPDRRALFGFRRLFARRLGGGGERASLA